MVGRVEAQADAVGEPDERDDFTVRQAVRGLRDRVAGVLAGGTRDRPLHGVDHRVPADHGERHPSVIFSGSGIQHYAPPEGGARCRDMERGGGPLPGSVLQDQSVSGPRAVRRQARVDREAVNLVAGENVPVAAQEATDQGAHVLPDPEIQPVRCCGLADRPERQTEPVIGGQRSAELHTRPVLVVIVAEPIESVASTVATLS